MWGWLCLECMDKLFSGGKRRAGGVLSSSEGVARCSACSCRKRVPASTVSGNNVPACLKCINASMILPA